MTDTITVAVVKELYRAKPSVRYQDLRPFTCFRFVEKPTQDLCNREIRIKIDDESYFKPAAGRFDDNKPLRLVHTSYDADSEVEVLDAHLTVQQVPPVGGCS